MLLLMGRHFVTDKKRMAQVAMAFGIAPEHVLQVHHSFPPLYT